MDALDKILADPTEAAHNLEHVHHGLLKHEEFKESGPFKGFHHFTVVSNDAMLMIHPKDIAQYLIL